MTEASSARKDTTAADESPWNLFEVIRRPDDAISASVYVHKYGRRYAVLDGGIGDLINVSRDGAGNYLDESQGRYWKQDGTAGYLGDRRARSKPDDWPEPADLSASIGSAPYPVDAFPEPARNAVMEYHRFGRQPLALVASSALGQMALAAQALADVARNDHLVSPISLYLLVTAESGERKSAADKQFGRAARQWQREEREFRLKENRRASAMEKDWKARVDGVKKKISGMAGKDSEDDSKECERLRDRLIDLEQDPIIAPPLPLLTYEDVTPAALSYALGLGWPSAGLYSDEGGAVVGSHGLGEDTATSFLSLLNVLWDGRDFVPTRKQALTFGD